MPHYFFNVRNNIYSKDMEGIALPDLEAARNEALKDIEEIKRTHFEHLDSNWPKWCFEVCNEQDEIILVVPFSAN